MMCKKKMSDTGIEPMSPAWKANMLTTTPTARFICKNLKMYIHVMYRYKHILNSIRIGKIPC